jgi:hypothetical protein
VVTAPVKRASETVLLIEDAAGVRQLAKRMLDEIRSERNHSKFFVFNMLAENERSRSAARVARGGS